MIIGSDNSIYYIMFQDKPVAKIDMGKGECNFREDLCPYGLNLIAEPGSFNERYRNLTAFMEWCAGRMPFMQRKFAPQMCSSLNIPLDDSPSALADIAVTYHCSTLKDAWWVKKKDVDINYSDVSLFHNKTENLMTPVSLFGEQIKIDGNLPNWCDMTIGGFSPKSWNREEGKYYLYKKSRNAVGEIAASKVLASMGADVVHYGSVMVRESMFVKTQCFTSEQFSFIPCHAFVKKCGLKAINDIRTQFLTQYANMIVAAYLVGNEDLSDKNWGVLMDNRTGKIAKIAPLFGFDQCFLKYDAMTNFVIREVAANYAKYAELDYSAADISVIPENFRDTFLSRCEDMEALRENARMEEDTSETEKTETLK